MKFLMILALCLAMLAARVNAQDDETIFPYSSDDEGAIAEDYQHFLTGQEDVPPAVVNVTPPQIGLSGSRKPVKFYDVVLTLKDRTVRAGDRISASLYLDFVPPYPPELDGIIEYTLLDGAGNPLQSVIRVVKEGDRNEEVSYVVPSTAAPGQWRFVTTWTVKDLEPMRAEEVFTVAEEPGVNPLALLVLGAVVIGGGALVMVGGARRRETK